MFYKPILHKKMLFAGLREECRKHEATATVTGPTDEDLEIPWIDFD